MRPSKLGGRGVFATKALRRGEIIERSPVILLPKNEGDALLETILGRYMFQTDDNTRFVFALGLASLINHNDQANAEFFVSVESISIVAQRSIAKGDEIFHDYGWTEEEWQRAGVKKK